MKTVLHVIEQLADFGGTPRKLLYLAAHHDADVNRLIFSTYFPSFLKKDFEQHQVKIVNLDTLSVWKLAWRIAQMVRTDHADVICTHYTRPLIAGFLASRLTGVPFIHNEHSSAHYRKGIARRAAQFCMPFSRAVICNSKYTAATIVGDYKIDPSDVRVLYNPVELRPQKINRNKIRQEAGIMSDTLVIGHIGGMIATRDQSTLVKAFQRINGIYPNSRLWLVGDGPLRKTLEDLAGELCIASNVTFLGYTDRVGDYLQAMDIYVNPTVDEGFGIAVVEAMLAGLPVVLADAGAHPELINDGKQGVLYSPGVVDALVQALKHLIEQPQWRHFLAEAGREIARSRFAPSRYARGYEKIIEEVTQGRISRTDRAPSKAD